MQFQFSYVSFSIAWLGIWLIMAGDSGSATTRPTSNSAAPCELTISFAKTSFQQGEAVYINVTTTNRLGHKTILSRPEAEPIFMVVFDGKPVEYTRFGKVVDQDRAHHDGSNHGIILDGTESRTEQFVLSRWVDLTLVGHYEVRVVRHVADAASNELRYTVESNPLTFEMRD